MARTPTLIHYTLTLVVAAAMLLALPLGVWATEPPAPKVSLIICDPGSEIYELEGHAALRLDYSGSGGPDLTVNWGLFDFNSPNFVYRFVSGHTDYMAGVIPTDRFLSQYRYQGRGVREYPLDLTDTQALAVDSLVARNLQPENRVYLYNYVLDNCATRPLDILQAAGHHVPLPPHPELPDGTTFRQAMRHYHTNYPWYQFGIDLALGSGLDTPRAAEDMRFAPAAVADMLHLGGITPVQLVEPGEGGPLPPTPGPLHPLTVCWAIFCFTVIVSAIDLRRRHLSRWYDTILFGAYGIAGCVVFFLVFVSIHEATSPNWVALWLNPAALLPAILAWLKNTKKMLIPYQIANFGALFALLVIWWAGVQHLNAAFLPLILSGMARSGTYLAIAK